jgi:hypothetical protein
MADLPLTTQENEKSSIEVQPLCSVTQPEAICLMKKCIKEIKRALLGFHFK